MKFVAMAISLLFLMPLAAQDYVLAEDASRESPAVEENVLPPEDAAAEENPPVPEEVPPAPKKTPPAPPKTPPAPKKPQPSSPLPVSQDTGQPIEMHNANPDQSADTQSEEEGEDEEKALSGDKHTVTIPKAKKPKKGDSDKISTLDAEDTEEDREKRRDAIRFGLESEIGDLIDELAKNEDPRYAEELYDLFQDTKNIVLKEKLLNYFGKMEDPCVEDYAITILDDPYDERQSTVNACFDYVKKVKTKEAVGPVLNLLESDNEEYFNQCLDTLGKVGGSDEAVYLTDYLERDYLTVPQKQALVRVLGELKATETYDKLVEIAQDKDENTFMRMYSAEAIGAMGDTEAVPVLLDLYEDTDPNMRIYVIKGLSHFPQDADARKIIIQGIRDSYYKVRMEAIGVVKEQGITAAVPYLIHRAKNDPEKVVKEATYPVIAQLNTKEGNEFLVGLITDKKIGDNTKAKVAQALLAENNAGTKEILALAKEIVGDDMKNNPRKNLRYALGKEFAKYKRSEFADICADYLASKDVATQGTGLDIYNKGKYSSVEAEVRKLAEQYDPTAKTKNPNAQKAARILGISEEEATKKAEERKAAKEAEKAKEKKEAKESKEAAKKVEKKPAPVLDAK